MITEYGKRRVKEQLSDQTHRTPTTPDSSISYNGGVLFQMGEHRGIIFRFCLYQFKVPIISLFVRDFVPVFYSSLTIDVRAAWVDCFLYSGFGLALFVCVCVIYCT